MLLHTVHTFISNCCTSYRSSAPSALLLSTPMLPEAAAAAPSPRASASFTRACSAAWPPCRPSQMRKRLKMLRFSIAGPGPELGWPTALPMLPVAWAATMAAATYRYTVQDRASWHCCASSASSAVCTIRAASESRSTGSRLQVSPAVLASAGSGTTCKGRRKSRGQKLHFQRFPREGPAAAATLRDIHTCVLIQHKLSQNSPAR